MSLAGQSSTVHGRQAIFCCHLICCFPGIRHTPSIEHAEHNWTPSRVAIAPPFQAELSSKSPGCRPLIAIHPLDFPSTCSVPWKSSSCDFTRRVLRQANDNHDGGMVGTGLSTNHFGTTRGLAPIGVFNERRSLAPAPQHARKHSTPQPNPCRQTVRPMGGRSAVWGRARDRMSRPIAIDREPEDPTDAAWLIAAMLHCRCLCRLPKHSPHPRGPRTRLEALAIAPAQHSPRSTAAEDDKVLCCGRSIEVARAQCPVGRGVMDI